MGCVPVLCHRHATFEHSSAKSAKFSFCGWVHGHIGWNNVLTTHFSHVETGHRCPGWIFGQGLDDCDVAGASRSRPKWVLDAGHRNTVPVQFESQKGTTAFYSSTESWADFYIFTTNFAVSVKRWNDWCANQFKARHIEIFARGFSGAFFSRLPLFLLKFQQ